MLSGVLFVLYKFTPAYQFTFLESGNIIMLALTLGAYFLVRRQMGKTPGAFVRGVSGASFMKLMVCMVSMLVYVMLNRANIHKPSIFVLFGIYAAYTASETVLLSKMAREK